MPLSRYALKLPGLNIEAGRFGEQPARLWFWLFDDLRNRVVEVISDGPVSNFDRLALQLAIFKDDETGNHLGPVTKLVELVAVGFATEIAPLSSRTVISVMLPRSSYLYSSLPTRAAIDGIGSVLNSITLEAVGGDLD
jgi:hypothetical protein